MTRGARCRQTECSGSPGLAAPRAPLVRVRETRRGGTEGAFRSFGDAAPRAHGLRAFRCASEAVAQGAQAGGGQRAVLRVTWKRDRRRSRAPQRARTSATPGVGSREPQERLAAGRARGPADVGEAWGPRRGRPLRSARRRVHASVCAARDSRGPTSCRPLAASDGRPPSLRPVADTSLLKTPQKGVGGNSQVSATCDFKSHASAGAGRAELSSVCVWR